MGDLSNLFTRTYLNFYTFALIIQRLCINDSNIVYHIDSDIKNDLIDDSSNIKRMKLPQSSSVTLKNNKFDIRGKVFVKQIRIY